MEVNFRDLGEDVVQELGPVEPPDLGIEVELLDDIAGVGIEPGDPGAQVARDLGRVGEDALEVQRRRVVRLRPRDLL
jgi:hypothetical protein